MNLDQAVGIHKHIWPAKCYCSSGVLFHLCYSSRYATKYWVLQSRSY